MTLTLQDEEGNDVEFNVLTKLDIEENEYVIVYPKDSDVDEVIALKIQKDEDDNDLLVTIEDEEEFQLVAEAYETLFADEQLN